MQNKIKYYLLLILVVWVVPFINGQSETKNDGYKIIRSNLGVAGSSNAIHTFNGKYIISQSIGQSSVIGTSKNNGYYLRQGFQQPHKRIKVIQSTTNSLNALVYPNPFQERITILFNENLSDKVIVEIHDVSGKLVYKSQFSPSRTIQLHLSNLSTGSYLIKANSKGKVLNSKLIKI